MNATKIAPRTLATIALVVMAALSAACIGAGPTGDGHESADLSDSRTVRLHVEGMT